jgi:hypothetical protein
MVWCQQGLAEVGPGRSSTGADRGRNEVPLTETHQRIVYDLLGVQGPGIVVETGRGRDVEPEGSEGRIGPSVLYLE